MYSAELERHKREKEEWKRKADRLEDQASALQVNSRDLISVTKPPWPPSSLWRLAALWSALLSASSTWTRPTLLWNQLHASPTSSTCRRRKWRSWKSKVCNNSLNQSWRWMSICLSAGLVTALLSETASTWRHCTIVNQPLLQTSLFKHYVQIYVFFINQAPMEVWPINTLFAVWKFQFLPPSLKYWTTTGRWPHYEHAHSFGSLNWCIKKILHQNQVCFVRTEGFPFRNALLS